MLFIFCWKVSYVLNTIVTFKRVFWFFSSYCEYMWSWCYFNCCPVLWFVEFPQLKICFFALKLVRNALKYFYFWWKTPATQLYWTQMLTICFIFCKYCSYHSHLKPAQVSLGLIVESIIEVVFFRSFNFFWLWSCRSEMKLYTGQKTIKSISLEMKHLQFHLFGRNSYLDMSVFLAKFWLFVIIHEPRQNFELTHRRLVIYFETSFSENLLFQKTYFPLC